MTDKHILLRFSHPVSYEFGKQHDFHSDVGSPVTSPNKIDDHLYVQRSVPLYVRSKHPSVVYFLPSILFSIFSLENDSKSCDNAQKNDNVSF